MCIAIVFVKVFRSTFHVMYSNLKEKKMEPQALVVSLLLPPQPVNANANAAALAQILELCTRTQLIRLHVCAGACQRCN